MATEQLIVELDAKTAKLDAKLKKVERNLDELDGTTKKTDSSLKKFGGAAGVAGAAVLKIGAAVVALGAAISAMTLKASSSRKELEQFARQAKTSEENFQSLAFATKQYGINAEQIADISKDISDKVGEFSAAGTGTFQDYADVMKLTKEEARQTAIEFQSLSSEQVIGTMVSQMEAAGVSGSQMTFVLESMGNDLSKLTPLFANNASELNKLKSRFDNINSSMNITAHQAEGLKEVSTSFDLMQASMGKSATAISATLAPVINDFFNDVIEVVPTATQAIIDFANSFLEAENISSQQGVLKEIKASTEEIAELEVKIAEEREKSKNSMNALTRGLNSFNLDGVLEQERERLEQLQAQLEVLKEQDRLADARKLEGGEIGGTTGAGLDGGGGTTALGTGDEIDAIADRFKTELELLQEKLDEELSIVGDNHLLRLALVEDFERAKNKIIDSYSKDEVKTSKLTEREKLNIQQTSIRAGMALNEKLLDDNKAIGAGLIVADAAVGVMRAFKDSNFYVALGQSAIIIATAATQLSNLQSAGRGGGSMSVGSGGASSTSPTQPDFVPETAGLDFSESSAGGGRSEQTIRFAVDSGDELVDAIAAALNKSQAQGRG